MPGERWKRELKQVTGEGSVKAALSEYHSQERFLLRSTFTAKEELKSRLVFADTYSDQLSKLFECLPVGANGESPLENPEVKAELKQLNLWEAMKDYSGMMEIKTDRKCFKPEWADKPMLGTKSERKFRSQTLNEEEKKELKKSMLPDVQVDGGIVLPVEDRKLEGLRQCRKWMYENSDMKKYETRHMGSDGPKRAFVNQFMMNPLYMQYRAVCNVENRFRKLDKSNKELMNQAADYADSDEYVPDSKMFGKRMTASKAFFMRRFAGTHLYWGKLTEGLAAADAAATPDELKAMKLPEKEGKAAKDDFDFQPDSVRKQLLKNDEPEMRERRNSFSAKGKEAGRDVKVKDISDLLNQTAEVYNQSVELERNQNLSAEERERRLLENRREIRELYNRAKEIRRNMPAPLKDSTETAGNVLTIYQQLYKSVDTIYQNLRTDLKEGGYLTGKHKSFGTGLIRKALDEINDLVEKNTGKKPFDIDDGLVKKIDAIEGITLNGASAVLGALGLVASVKDNVDKYRTNTKAGVAEGLIGLGHGGVKTTKNVMDLIEKVHQYSNPDYVYEGTAGVFSKWSGFIGHAVDFVKNTFTAIRAKVHHGRLKDLKTKIKNEINRIDDANGKTERRELAAVVSGDKRSEKWKSSAGVVGMVFAGGAALVAVPTFGIGAAVGSTVTVAGLAVKQFVDGHKSTMERNKAIDQGLLKDKAERERDQYPDIQMKDAAHPKVRTIDVEVEKHRSCQDEKLKRFEDENLREIISKQDNSSMKRHIRIEAAVRDGKTGPADYFAKTHSAMVAKAYKAIMYVEKENGELVSVAEKYGNNKERYEREFLGKGLEAGQVTNKQRMRMNYYEFLEANGQNVNIFKKTKEATQKQIDKLAKAAKVSVKAADKKGPQL